MGSVFEWRTIIKENSIDRLSEPSGVKIAQNTDFLYDIIDIIAFIRLSEIVEPFDKKTAINHNGHLAGGLKTVIIVMRLSFSRNLFHHSQLRLFPYTKKAS